MLQDKTFIKIFQEIIVNVYRVGYIMNIIKLFLFEDYYTAILRCEISTAEKYYLDTMPKIQYNLNTQLSTILRNKSKI